MKKSFVLYILSAACLLAGCQREAVKQEEGLKEIKFRASVESATKATATAFEEGDQICLNIGAPVNVEYAVLTPDRDALVPENPLYWPVDMKQDQVAKFVAYYPYDVSIYGRIGQYTGDTWEGRGLAADQYKDNTYKSQDFMSAVTVASPADGCVDLRFKHLMSSFNLTVVDHLKADSFSGVQNAEFCSVEVREVTAWFDINFPEQFARANYDVGASCYLYPNRTGNNTYSLILPPQTVAPEIVITLDSGKTMTYKSTTPIPFVSGQRVSATLILSLNQILFEYQIEDWVDDDTDVKFVDITGTPPSDEIWYTSVGGGVVPAHEDAFFGENVTLISNTYENGKGILKFSGAVTTIGSEAFSNWAQDYTEFFNSVVLPEGCQSIGSSAFQYQEFLEEIRLPLTLQYLEWGALYGCRALREIVLPDNLKGIGAFAFCYCEQLQEVTIPESVEYVDGGAFSDCTGLVQFNGKFADASGRALIDGNVLLAIAPSGLTSYRVPDGVRYIYSATFGGMTNLTKIVIPDGVRAIYLQAFSHCEGLQDVVIPESVNYLGGGVFRGCYKLANVQLPSGLTRIESELFGWCRSLESIWLPEGIEFIGSMAFGDCEKLKTITIPSVVTSIGSSAFAGCRSLESVVVKAVNPPAGAERMFDDTNDCPIYVPAESVDAYKEAEYWSYYANRIQAISEGKQPNNEIWYTSTDGNVVELYRVNDFGGAQMVSNTYSDGKGVIKFDADLTQFGNRAFFSCTSLKSVKMPESITSVGNQAFTYCYNLETIYIPGSVTRIDYRCFANCRNLVRFEGNLATADGRCIILDEKLVGFAPAGLTSYEFDNSITVFGDSVLEGCRSLEEVVLPDGLLVIETSAFDQCVSLQNLIIPDTVTSIGQYAFIGCDALTSVRIPDSVATLSSGAFARCKKLSSFSGKYASGDGRALIVNNTMVAFAPAGLESYRILDGVTRVEYETFSSLNELKTIVFPASVQSIGSYAVNYCSNLTSLVIEATTPPTGADDMFSSLSNCSIYVPAESLETYKTAQYWSNYAQLIHAIE